jgi:magnesium transporter
MSSTNKNQLQTGNVPPGQIKHLGPEDRKDIKISVTLFNSDNTQQKAIKSIDEILEMKDTPELTWVNIEGANNQEQIKKIGAHFHIHELVLEDILNTNQRPKVEFHSDYIYIVLKRWILESSPLTIGFEQVSILMLKNFVFTFKERQDSLFDSLIKQFKAGKDVFKSRATDFLTYLIMDTIVDEYFILQDPLEDVIEKIDSDLLTNPSTETLQSIQRVKRELIFVQKTVLPLREVLNSLQHRSFVLIHDETKLYLHDIYDHVMRVNEQIESYRELITGMMGIYLSSVSNRMNEVMKVLTVFASIFIPLTFLAGIYGMNFKFMPELEWKWGYPVMWGMFILIPVSLLIYFKRKKWL